MSNKNYNVPLNEEQRYKIRKAMENTESLAEITCVATVHSVINYLLEDKPVLERYLTEMAGSITKQRQRISQRTLIPSIFHARQVLSKYNKDFQVMLINTINRERELQMRVFVAENHLQMDIHSDLWKMYYQYGDVLRFNSLNFNLIRCPSLRYELKYYTRYMFECTGKTDSTLFGNQIIALNALTEVNSRIKYFADITEADVKAALLFLENSCGKNSGTPLSQSTIASAIKGVRRVVDYLMSDMRNDGIKAPRPYKNPFAKFIFRNLDKYKKPTPVIPDDVIEQINNHSDELSPLHKLLYDIFVNTGLRLKEVFFLEADCIEESRYAGVCQLKFTPYKVIAARRRHGIGDYHRVMIPQALADKISCHISNTVFLRESNESTYIFLSIKTGYNNTKAIMDSNPFLNEVRNIITKYDIRDENDELWHFTIKQFRKTVAVTLIENGATTEELAYWLGHMGHKTAEKYYAEVRKMKLAGLNTKFFKEKFDLILSNEQLEEYTEEERKLLYIDFRLEQRRVELGYCLRKAPYGRCPNRNSIYNCVNCKNLCTGEKYLPYWNDLLTQQANLVEMLVRAYHANGIEGYADFAEYKQECRLLKSYKSIVARIEEGGCCK